MIHAATFLFEIATTSCSAKPSRFSSKKEIAVAFFNEAVVHIPFVLPLVNLWRFKVLYSLNYGMAGFKVSDSKRVEKILNDAARASYAETIYEAGPQAVTQVTASLLFSLSPNA